MRVKPAHEHRPARLEGRRRSVHAVVAGVARSRHAQVLPVLLSYLFYYVIVYCYVLSLFVPRPWQSSASRPRRIHGPLAAVRVNIDATAL